MGPSTQNGRTILSQPYFTPQPHKIGVMIDLPESPGCSDLFVAGLEIAFEEARERGLLDRPVELVVREYASQPWAEAHRNIDAYRDLVVNENVLAIAGPMTTDNSMSILKETAKLEVPSISICGSQEYAGPYAFSLPNGGMADEPFTILSWMKSKGHKRVALIRETPSQIGEEYANFARLAARQLDMAITIEYGVSPVGNLDDLEFGPQDEVDRALAAARATEPDSLLYFGLGHITGLLSKGIKKMGWDIPRYTGTVFVGAAYTQEYVDIFDGWVGLDQFVEGNPPFDNLMALYEKKFGKRLEWPTSVFTLGYDIGRTLAVAMDRMRIATPEALRNALETVTRLPAATGAPGTVIGFSPYSHRGLRGADYLLVRESRGGKNLYLGTAPKV